MKLGAMQGRLVKREIKSRMQSFPWKNWKKEFKLLDQLGVRNLEWTLDYKNFFNNPINTKKGCNEITKLKRKYKVNLNSLTADFFMQKPIFKKKFKNFEAEMLNKIKYLIKNCNLVGIRYIVFPLVDNSSIKNKYEIKNLILFLKKIELTLEKYKVQILFESDFEPRKLLSFIKRINKKYFGINYDTGNSTALQYDFNKEMNYYKFIKNVHLKDRSFKGSSKKFGMGNTNFYEIINFLKKKKYNGNLIFQSALPLNKNPIGEFNHNLNFIKKLIK
jgi:L-ribulose-5-phosphate 3-epimerase